MNRRLAELRFNAGLTPDELGEKTGVSGQTIRRLEQGTTPTPKIAKKVAKHFNLDPTDLWPIEELAS